MTRWSFLSLLCSQSKHVPLVRVACCGGIPVRPPAFLSGSLVALAAVYCPPRLPFTISIPAVGFLNSVTHASLVVFSSECTPTTCTCAASPCNLLREGRTVHQSPLLQPDVFPGWVINRMIIQEIPPKQRPLHDQTTNTSPWYTCHPQTLC